MSTNQEKIQWSPTYTVFTSRLYRGCFHRRFTLFFDGTYFLISDFLVVYLTMENIHWSPTCTVFTRRLYRSCFHRRFALFFDGAYWWFPIFYYFSVVYLTMSTCQENIHWSPTCTVFTSRLYRGCFHRRFTLFFDGAYWWFPIFYYFSVVYLTMEKIHWSPTCTVFTSRLYRGCFHRRFTLFFDGAYWWFPIFYYFSVV